MNTTANDSPRRGKQVRKDSQNADVVKSPSKAPERKSFVFFLRWSKILKNLPAMVRLSIYDAITEYVETGNAPDLDMMAQVAFDFIKADLDNMLEKYETTCEKRRDAANKRWQRSKKQNAGPEDSYRNNGDAYDSTDADSESVEESAKSHVVCKSMQNYNLHYDNDHDNDHENENENENGNENENENGQKEINKIISSSAANNISRKGASAAEAAADGFGLEDRIAELKKRPKWIEQLAKRFKISQAEIIRRLDEFRDDMELRGKVVNNPQSLFVTWLGDLKKSAKPDEPAEPNFGPGEYRNAKGERTYARGEVIVPEDAPPRPAKGYWWSRPSNAWCNLF